MDQLKVHNSLKPGPPVPFVPIEKGKISWYVCGPTVYDHSHLGHARNYVATDIIRRILRDYFGFKINFVMNITDVDDKVRLIWIILKLVQTTNLPPDHSQSAPFENSRAREGQDSLGLGNLEAWTGGIPGICQGKLTSAIIGWPGAHPWELYPATG